jgi:hypothetical protein
LLEMCLSISSLPIRTIRGAEGSDRPFTPTFHVILGIVRVCFSPILASFEKLVFVCLVVCLIVSSFRHTQAGVSIPY